MAQSISNEEFVFEKLNELNYERLIVIAKGLDFKEQHIANKDTMFSLFQVMWKYLSSTWKGQPLKTKQFLRN